MARALGDRDLPVVELRLRTRLRSMPFEAGRRPPARDLVGAATVTIPRSGQAGSERLGGVEAADLGRTDPPGRVPAALRWLISHNMPQVFDVADRIHIQRLGRAAGVISPQSHTPAEAVAIMTGATTLEESTTSTQEA